MTIEWRTQPHPPRGGLGLGAPPPFPPVLTGHVSSLLPVLTGHVSFLQALAAAPGDVPALVNLGALYQVGVPAAGPSSARSPERVSRARAATQARLARRQEQDAVAAKAEQLYQRCAPPPLRTKWTRRVPRPVLIGPAASPTPY